MKAVILTAGQGTRLRPVTLTMPKSLVPVANRWLITYAIDVLKLAGLNDIGVVVNNLESPIVTLLGDGGCLGVKIEYIVQEQQLGLAHAINLCQDFVGDEPFTVFLGDNIFQDQMTDLLTSFADSDAEANIVLAEPKSTAGESRASWKNRRFRLQTWRLPESTSSAPLSSMPSVASSRRVATSWKSPMPFKC